MPAADAAPLWPVLVYIGLAVLVALGMLGVSYVLGERRRREAGRGEGEPYEAGIVGAGPARQRISVKYFLVALFFVVFDLEVAFLIAWAVAARELGWAGYVSMAVFVFVLGAALFYLWRLGALDWGTSAHKKRRSA